MSKDIESRPLSTYRLDDIVEQFMDFRGRTPMKLGMEWGGGDIRALSANNVQMGRVDFDKESHFGSEELYRRWMTKGECKKGDVLLTTEAPLGNVAQVPDHKKYILSQRTILLKAKLARANPDFLFQLFRSEPFQAALIANSTGTTVVGIQVSKLAKLEVAIPSVFVQRKIARILTTVDNLIETTEALIAKYQAIKQGMMHDLFTRGVDEHGHLRPPYEEAPHLYKQSELGWIPKEWECVTLGAVVPVAQYGISVPLDDLEGIPVLRMNNLGKGVIDATDIKQSKHPEARRLLLKHRDVLFNRTNSIDHVGRTSIWKSELPEASFASYLVRLVPNTVRLMPEYFVYWMNRPESQTAIRQFATPGVHQVNINPTNLRKSLLAFPSSMPEQAAITKITLQHEKRIGFEQQYLSKLSKQKSGLMQDLLTGKVRVKVGEDQDATDG